MTVIRTHLYLSILSSVMYFIVFIVIAFFLAASSLPQIFALVLYVNVI